MFSTKIQQGWILLLILYGTKNYPAYRWKTWYNYLRIPQPLPVIQVPEKNLTMAAELIIAKTQILISSTHETVNYGSIG